MVDIMNLKLFWIQLQICFGEGKCYTHPKKSSILLCSQLTASPYAAVWLLHCGVQAALQLLQSLGRCQVLQTAEKRGHRGPFKHMIDVTGIEVCWACLSAIQEPLEIFKLRDYQRDQPQGHNPAGALRSSEGFQAGEGR